MTATTSVPFRTPYTPTPGSSTPGPDVDRAAGRKDLKDFFWLSLANSAIIAVAGLATWLVVR